MKYVRFCLAIAASAIVVPALAASDKTNDAGKNTGERNTAMAMMSDIRFASGKMLPYYTTQSLNQAHPGIDRVLIIIPGGTDNGPSYFNAGLDAARKAGEPDKTAVMALQFQTESENPRREELYWTGDWQQGSNSLDASHTSSFAVIDDVLALTLRNFPNARSIVLAGHSSGGQIINRYAALGGNVADDGKISFVAMNPSSYIYMDARRPQPDGSFAVPSDAAAACPNYNQWKYGLATLPPYAAGRSASEVREMMFRRHITYLAGGADNQTGEGVDDRCGGEYEGKVRLERARNYWRYIQMFPAWRANVRTAIVPGIGHAGGDMIRSDTFVTIAFGGGSKGLR